MDLGHKYTFAGGWSFPTTGGRLLLDPAEDGLGGGGGGVDPGAEIVPAEPVPTDGGANRDELVEVAPETPADAGGSAALPTPADPNLARGGGTPAQYQSIRDAAKGYGFDLSQFGDDRAAFAHLVQQAQRNAQADYYAQLGRQIAPHYQGVTNYLQQQQAQAQAPAAPQPWERPEFDKRWMSLVDRDEASGVFLAKPGVNPVIADKVNTFAQWYEGYQADPIAVQEKLIETRAREIAGSEFDRRMGEYQQRQQVGQILEQNASWLYAADDAGRRLTNAQGGYQPSPLGTRYIQHLQGLAQAGVSDPAAQDRLARQYLAGEIALARLQQQQAADPAQAVARNQAAGLPNVNPLQAVPPQRRQQNPAATEPSTAGMSLADLLRAGLKEEGVTDADFEVRD